MALIDDLNEIFPHADMNDDLEWSEIVEKANEEEDEVVEERYYFFCDKNNEVRSVEYCLELLDRARMSIEELRKVCELVGLDINEILETFDDKLTSRGLYSRD